MPGSVMHAGIRDDRDEGPCGSAGSRRILTSTAGGRPARRRGGMVMIIARGNRRLSGAGLVVAAIGLALLTAPAAHPGTPAAHTSAGSLSGAALRAAVAQRRRTPDTMSSGLRTWLAGRPSAARARRAATPALGTTVDANNPALDLAAGQSETGIAAQRSGARTLVLAAWNDI